MFSSKSLIPLLSLFVFKFGSTGCMGLVCRTANSNVSEDIGIKFNKSLNITCELIGQEKELFENQTRNAQKITTFSKTRLKNQPWHAKCNFSPQSLGCEVIGEETDSVFSNYDNVTLSWNIILTRHQSVDNYNNTCNIYAKNVMCHVNHYLYQSLGEIYRINDVGEIVITNSSWQVKCDSLNQQLTCGLRMLYIQDFKHLYSTLNSTWHLDIKYDDWDISCDVENKTVSCDVDRKEYSEYTQLNYINSDLDVTIENTTWSKKFVVKSNDDQPTWDFTLHHLDFYEIYSNLKLPSKFSSNQHSMKWTIKAELCHSLLVNCLTYKGLVYEPNYDPLLQSNWGIAETPNNLIASRKVIHAKQPCGSAVSLIIQSNDQATHITLIENELVVDTYKWICKTSNSDPCFDQFSSVHDVVITKNRVLFLTSDGLFASDMFRVNCENSCNQMYHKLDLNITSGISSTSFFSYTPICAGINQVDDKEDTLLISLMLQSSEQTMVVKLDANNINIADKQFSNNSQLVMAKGGRFWSFQPSSTRGQLTYSVFSGTKLLHTGSMQDNMPMIPQHMQLTSANVLYVGMKNNIWISVDGGIYFQKIHELGTGEVIISSSTNHVDDTVVFLTHTSLIVMHSTHVEAISVNNIHPNSWISHIGGSLSDLNIMHIKQNGEIATNKVNVYKNKHCRFKLSADVKHNSIQYIDIQEMFTYTVYIDMVAGFEATYLKPQHSITSSSQSLHISSAVIENDYSILIRITAHVPVAIESIATVSIHILNANECIQTTHNVIFKVGCMPSKRLDFNYFSIIERPELSVDEYNDEQVPNILYELQRNYRPPSSMAVAIPLSSHVYNVNPTTTNQSRFLQYSFTGQYKLKTCEGHKTREACNCSLAQKHSSLVEYSDCRERVYKVRYDIDYKLSLTLHTEEDSRYVRPETNNVFVYLEEINGRNKDVFVVTDNLVEKCKLDDPHPICKLMKPSEKHDLQTFMSNNLNLFNASDLSVKLQGTGLFHFRITVARGLSFCRLTTEFQVYVINSPLPFPEPTIIRITVTFLMASTIIIIYAYFVAKDETKSRNMKVKRIRPEKNANEITRRNTSRVEEKDVNKMRRKLRASMHLEVPES